MVGRRKRESGEGDENRNLYDDRTSRVSSVGPSELPVLKTPEDRIRYIAELMRENAWPVWPDSARFRKRLAVHWDVSESTIRNYSAEAHRIVAMDPEEREQLKADIAKRLNGISERAATERNLVTGLPDFCSAIKAMETAAKFAGIELEQKVRLSGSVKLTDLDQLETLVSGTDE